MYAKRLLTLALGLGVVATGLVLAPSAGQAGTNGQAVRVCALSGHVIVKGANSSGAVVIRRVDFGQVLCPNTGSTFQYRVTIEWRNPNGGLRKTTHCWVPPVSSSNIFECRESERSNKTPAQAAAACAQETSLRQKVVCVAWSQIGVSEIEMDGNSQPLKGIKPHSAGDAWHCNRYFHDTRWSEAPRLNCEGGGRDHEDSHWCAAFTRWVWLNAGVASSGVPKDYTAEGWSRILSRAGRQISGRSVKAGDYVNWNIGNTHHSGIVVRVHNSKGTIKIWVVEGNASDAVRMKAYTVGASGQPTGYYRLPRA